MGRAVNDLSGQKFGRLTVLDKHKRQAVGSNKDKKETYWWCRCDCGATKWICAQNFLKGTTKSCGCLRHEIAKKIGRTLQILPKGKSSENRVLAQYKKHAADRDLAWALTDKEALALMSQNCEYCASRPTNEVVSNYNNGNFVYSGIDRVDNAKGYVKGNCVPCCKVCNRAKNNMAASEWLAYLDKIVANHQKRALVA